VNDQRLEASAQLLGLEQCDILLSQRLTTPLLLVLAKNLNRVAAGPLAVAKGLVPRSTCARRISW
jgi:hypothetical protein